MDCQIWIKNKERLVHNTSDFEKGYHIFGSRQTFLALIPAINQVEDQYINTLLSKELLLALKSEPTEEKLIELKKIKIKTECPVRY